MNRGASFKRGILAAALLAAIGSSASAVTLRTAGANDILTTDPMSQNHQTTHAYMQQVYESLVRYDDKYQTVPALATKWTQTSPTQVRFELRKGV